LVPAWYQIAANLVSIAAVMAIVAHREAGPAIETEAPV
jgi:hypothetical protein